MNGWKYFVQTSAICQWKTCRQCNNGSWLQKDNFVRMYRFQSINLSANRPKIEFVKFKFFLFLNLKNSKLYSWDSGNCNSFIFRDYHHKELLLHPETREEGEVRAEWLRVYLRVLVTSSSTCIYSASKRPLHLFSEITFALYRKYSCTFSLLQPSERVS